MRDAFTELEVYTDQVKTANKRAINRIRAVMAAFVNVEQIERKLQQCADSGYSGKSSSSADPPRDVLCEPMFRVHPDK